MKLQLEEWKKEKEKRKLADMNDTEEHKMKISSSLNRREIQKRKEIKDQIEQYKFQKEMDLQKEK